MTEEDRANWLRDDFIPHLVNEKRVFDKVTAGGSWALKSCDVKSLQINGFMLTQPYKVKLIFRQAQEPASLLEYDLIVKVTPNVPADMYEGCQFDTLFENETTAYTEIIPLLGQAESYPRYFYSHRKDMEAIMVLEDFSTHGWRMSPKIVNLSMDHILLALKELGRFHGTCYGIKESDPALFRRIIATFKESRYSRDTIDPVWDEQMKVGPKRATKSVRESDLRDVIPEAFLRKIESELEHPVTYGRKAVVAKEPLAIICHGDYLRNNIAFKYGDEKNTEPIAAMMFDFQTLRYASPIIDVSTFLANSTSYAEREEHFDAIFQLYHDELIQALCQKANIEKSMLPEHYSYEAFLREFAEYYTFGFYIAASFLPILHVPYDGPIDEMLNRDEPMEYHINEAYTKGGEDVNKELRGMLLEMYQFQSRFGLFKDDE